LQSIATLAGDAPTCFAFFPDTSYLIVGTTLGQLLSYKITAGVLDPVAGQIAQNTIGKSVLSVAVSASGLIAAGGNN
jgi:hypothetical protein